MKDESDKTESDSEVEYLKSKKEYKDIISLDCFTLFQKIYTQLDPKNKPTLSDFSITLQVKKPGKFKVSESTIKDTEVRVFFCENIK